MTRVQVRAAFIERAAPANPCKHERKIFVSNFRLRSKMLNKKN
jgi:hypothetical protein